MKLYVTDQISISSVQADTLRPGDDFEVNDAQGEELLKALPNHLSKTAPKVAKAEAAPANKAEPKLSNKADALDHDGNGRKGGAKKPV